jgi:hypothetical protein
MLNYLRSPSRRGSPGIGYVTLHNIRIGDRNAWRAVAVIGKV